MRADLATELTALERARTAARATLDRLSGHSRSGGADAFADEYIEAVIAGAIERLQRELVVFGRIDDDRPWRVGLFGVDEGGDQLVIDWRAPFATGFYQARFDEPRGLTRRISYVGCIDDLLIEDFLTGEAHGTSPLMIELSRHRSETMRTAVATLQSEQDALVRLDPRARLALRGGPGTGKTVVGLHRAAWLVYNDQRVTADRILVLGPSDRYLRFVSTVLPALGEARVVQTTFDRLIGASCPAGSDERWIALLDRLEASLLRPAEVRIRRTTLREPEIAELVERFARRALPWRDRRRLFVDALATRCETPRAEVEPIVKAIWPACTLRQAWAKVRSRRTLRELGADDEFVDAWLAVDGDGALHDEVRARFQGVPARYSHVIVDEAQDMSLLQLRAVRRRAEGMTLVGDDAQRSNPLGLGLRRGAALTGAELAEMATAYRMSAEIADWLNEHAARHALDAVELVGIRPTGTPVGSAASVAAAESALRVRWPAVTTIRRGEVWDHKGVEYDAVVVDTAGLSPAEIYLAASRAAHELMVVAR
jgi:DNA helicase IV